MAFNVSTLYEDVNSQYAGVPPAQIMMYTAAATLVIERLAHTAWYTDWAHLPRDLKRWAITKAVDIPFVHTMIENEFADDMAKLQDDIFAALNLEGIDLQLPKEGQSHEALLAEAVKKFENEFAAAGKGELSGAVYTRITRELLTFVGTIYGQAAYANCLHTGDFLSSQACEIALVQMLKSMYSREQPSKPAFGRVTSGGTESNVSAMYAYFRRARSLGIQRPVIIVPETIHASIRTKAILDPRMPKDLCEMFGSVVEVSVTPEGKIDIPDLNRKLLEYRGRVAGIAVSYPCYPYMVADDIEAVCRCAEAYSEYTNCEIGVHVDACMGSLLAPFATPEGRLPYDHPRVWSMSADPHKYGQVVKGVSAVWFHDEKLLEHQLPPVDDSWVGGLYGTPGPAGSRPSGLAVVAYYTMKHFGEDGYRAAAEEIFNARRRVVDAISTINGIEVVGSPQFGGLAIRAVPNDQGEGIDLYVLKQRLKERGVPFACMLPVPSQTIDKTIHICLTMNHVDDEFIARTITALREGVAYCKEHPEEKAQGMRAMYAMSTTIRNYSPEIVRMIIREYVLTALRAHKKDYRPKDPYQCDDIRSLAARGLFWTYQGVKDLIGRVRR